MPLQVIRTKPSRSTLDDYVNITQSGHVLAWWRSSNHSATAYCPSPTLQDSWTMPPGERERVDEVGVFTSSRPALVEKCCNQTLSLIITIVCMVRDSISRHDAAHTLCHVQTSDQYQTRFPSRQISGGNLTLRSLYIYSIHILHITCTSVNARL
jgi:hypothetical protein